MNLHEFQAKKILKKYGIPSPPFVVASTVKEIEEGIVNLQLSQGVLKAQVHAGGRGKAGAVKLGHSKEALLTQAGDLLGRIFINHQTGTHGIPIQKLLLSPLIPIKKEYYVGAAIDRKHGTAILILSREGGMEIEETAAKFPEKIATIPIQLDGSLRGYHLIEALKVLEFPAEMKEKGIALLKNVARAFIDLDADLLEINPLVDTGEGEFVALDAKLSIDDNALYRHKELEELFDPSQVLPQEALAREQGLAYIALEGEIGCMVNGAGLAMATLDLIKHYGGNPANFLDVGGSATKEKVAEGFKIILADSNVKVILVNIFGGIMNCETLSQGIIAAAKELGVAVPIVVRMEGTNVEQGKKLLADSKLNIEIASDLTSAAKKVVELARGHSHQ